MWWILGTVAKSFWLCPGVVSVLSCRQRASRVLDISPYYWGKRRGSGRWWTNIFLPCWTIHDHDKVSGIKGILAPLGVYLLLLSSKLLYQLTCFDSFPYIFYIHPLLSACNLFSAAHWLMSSLDPLDICMLLWSFPAILNQLRLFTDSSVSVLIPCSHCVVRCLVLVIVGSDLRPLDRHVCSPFAQTYRWNESCKCRLNLFLIFCIV